MFVMQEILMYLVFSIVLSLSIVLSNFVKDLTKSELVKFQKISEAISLFRHLILFAFAVVSGILISFFNPGYLIILFIIMFLVFSIVFLSFKGEKSLKEAVRLALFFAIISFMVSLAGFLI